MRRSIIAAAALLLVACGNNGNDVDQFAEPTSTGQAADSDVQECEDRAIPKPEKDDGAGDEKPDVEVPEGAPPCELVIHDISEGSGDEVKEGATVTAHYVGVSWSTGEEFDSSWGGEPIEFSLLQVVPGWQQGIPGMREGGRRRLIIPPALGYGEEGYPPDIAGGETLIFIVDMVDAG